MKYIFCLLLFTTCIMPILAQDISGSWHEPNYNFILEFYPNGSFAFKGPNAWATGQYGIQGNKLILRDSLGQVFYYQFSGFDGNHMQLLDASGNRYNYSRKIQPEKSRVYAKKDGRELTDEQIEIGIGIIQFVIGQAIKESERKELVEQCKIEFKQKPADFCSGVKNLGNSLATLKSIRDPFMVAQLRQALVVEFYSNTRTLKECEKPLIIQIIDRYTKVLAYDEKNKLALTDKDLQSYLDYIAFEYQLKGQNANFSWEVAEKIKKYMVKNFQQFPLETRRFLCSAEIAWIYLQHYWQKLSAQQKYQIQSQFHTQNQVAQQVPPAKIQQTPSSSSPESLSSAMAKYNMTMETYKIMSDMSLQNHVTSLNIIENMAGSDNYYEVVNYNDY